MKHALARTAGLAALAAVLVAAGCSSLTCMFGKGRCVSYDEYLAIDQSASPKPTAEDVVKRLGEPMAVHDRNGKRRSIDYHAYSLTGDMKVAVFTFDENEKLVKKELW